MKQGDRDVVSITHYSDILCIWAFVSQVRMSELQKKFGKQIKVEYRFVTVFGDVASLIENIWSSRGGAVGYNEHVCSVAKQFTHVSVNSDIWKADAPASSLPAHLVLCAMRRLTECSELSESIVEKVAVEIRRAFFVDCKNVAKQSVLYDVIESCGVDVQLIDDCIRQGYAHAVLASDIQSANNLNIEISPTLLFNEDRQRLAGNVGYRIIEANVHELLEQRGNEKYSAWC